MPSQSALCSIRILVDSVLTARSISPAWIENGDISGAASAGQSGVSGDLMVGGGRMVGVLMVGGGRMVEVKVGTGPVH